jgi:two-component system response regulator MprA
MSAPKKKILVVEDDRLFSEIYAAKFAEEGFAVRLAGDGEDGWNQLHADRPDVLLLDLVLPKITGLELLAKIRLHDDPAIRDLPVIVVTNLNQDAFAEEINGHAVHAYFLKSDVIFSQVLEKVREITGR